MYSNYYKTSTFCSKAIFNSEGQKLYMENYLQPYKWTYLNEVVERSGDLKQQTGNFRITNAISKPRHVFVFIINTPNTESQTANPFFTTLSAYQLTQEHCQDVILKL